MTRYINFALAFILGLGVATAQAASMTGESYVGVSAVLDSELEEDGSDLSLEYGSGWTLTYGYNFADNISGEVNYTTIEDVTVTEGSASETLEMDTWDVSALIRRDFGSNSGFIRLGYGDAEVTVETGGITASGSESGYIYGVGIDFGVTEKGAVRLEYNTAEYDDLEIDRLQLGTIIKF